MIISFLSSVSLAIDSFLETWYWSERQPSAFLSYVPDIFFFFFFFFFGISRPSQGWLFELDCCFLCRRKQVEALVMGPLFSTPYVRAVIEMIRECGKICLKVYRCLEWEQLFLGLFPRPREAAVYIHQVVSSTYTSQNVPPHNKIEYALHHAHNLFVAVSLFSVSVAKVPK